MRETKLTLPEVGIIGGTRGLLGAGVALLLADRVSDSQRKTVGWTLFRSAPSPRCRSHS